MTQLLLGSPMYFGIVTSVQRYQAHCNLCAVTLGEHILIDHARKVVEDHLKEDHKLLKDFQFKVEFTEK